MNIPQNGVCIGSRIPQSGVCVELRVALRLQFELVVHTTAVLCGWHVITRYGYKGQYKVSHASPNIVPDGPMGILDLYQKRDRGAHCYQAESIVGKINKEEYPVGIPKRSIAALGPPPSDDPSQQHQPERDRENWEDCWRQEVAKKEPRYLQCR
eukprot:3376966-Rhodomonas_salina.1